MWLSKACTNLESMTLPRVRTLALGASMGVMPFAALSQAHEVPMKDVAIRGTLQSSARSMEIVAKAGIQTPLGRVPVSAHIRVSYDCSAAFTGTVSYHPLVRLFAKIKQVDLVTAVDGRVKTDSVAIVAAVDGRSNADSTPSCSGIAADSLIGQAKVETTLLSGWIKLDRDSIPFAGPAWAIGDSSYHSVVTVMRGSRQLEIRVNMYEYGLPKPPSASADGSVAPIAFGPRGRPPKK